MSSSLHNKFRSIQKNYDRMSHGYDWLEGWGERGISSAALHLLNIQPNERVLEIGSGTGSNLIRILSMKSPSGLVGLDLSLDMCLETSKKIHRLTPILKPDVVNGNAISLPFESNIFDVLFMLFSFEIIPLDAQRMVLAEFVRVLKPQARVCIASMSNEVKGGMMMRLYRWSIQKIPNIVNCQPIELAKVFEQGDFNIIKTESHSLWGLPVRIILAKRS